MKKNWFIALVVIVLLTALYFIEISKVSKGDGNRMPTLDNLYTDEIFILQSKFFQFVYTFFQHISTTFQYLVSISVYIKKESITFAIIKKYKI